MRGWQTYGRPLGLALAALAVLIIVPQCLLFPESGFVGEPGRNERPSVNITGGVLLDSVATDASIHFFWFGSDTDGVIRWFEWAIDDTVSEDGWHQTTSFDARIPFQAREQEAGDEFSGWHTFYVRAVDDDYSRSKADRRFFNAHTIAPETNIVSPEPSTEARWSSTIQVTWSGVDEDGSRADKLPAAFEYKLIQFPGPVNPGDIVGITEDFMSFPNQLLDSLSVQDFPDDPAYFNKARRGWIRVDGEVSSTWLRNLDAGRKYGFAVRAIDESGALEPTLGWHNWVIFDVQDRVIDVVVSEPSLGVHLFNSPEYTTWEVNIAPNQNIRFRWVGDAEDLGTEPGPSNYGFDIPEPDEEVDKAVDGIGGWIGWAERLRMINSISWGREEEGKTHNFYLKMRAVSLLEETETKCHIAINIARLSFSRKFLLVDDQRRAPRGCLFSTPKPDDGQSDALRMRLLQNMEDYLPEEEEPGVFESFGPRDEEPSPIVEDDFLSTLGTYQTVIWDVASANETLYRPHAINGNLARYRGAGGNLLMFFDQGSISPFVGTWQSTDDEPRCPTDLLTSSDPWDPFSFPYVHLHLIDCVDKPRQDEGPLAFNRMTMVSAQAEDPLYPDIDLRLQDWGCNPTDPKGVWHYEVLWPATEDPDEIPWFEREDGMEILYRARTYWSTSRLDSLPVAWRTFATAEDTLAGLEPGRIVAFAFHPWFFEESAMTSAVSLALQWVVTGSEF